MSTQEKKITNYLDMQSLYYIFIYGFIRGLTPKPSLPLSFKVVFQLLIDFQSLHAQQLEVYKNFTARKRRSVEPIDYGNRLAAKLKRLNNISGELVRARQAIVPAELRGQRVDLWVYRLKPSPEAVKLYI
ncbi:MAG: hypothetical protein JXQ83_10760 [Candidatus Glassbacteria bacterium]|nr:hypothetical protein [Candidatus Glassbacteria bacterium]